MGNRFWHIGNCSLFRQLAPDQLSYLEHSARLRSFCKGEFVYLPHDPTQLVFLLAAGRVRLCTNTPDGKQAILGFIEPGEIFGELALLQDSGQEDRAEAVTDCTVVSMSADAIRKTMDNSPNLALGVTKLMGFRRTRIERRLRSLLFRSNRDRLILLLIDLADQYGKKMNGQISLGIALSHQDLASIIGATRESTTLILGELQSIELIELSRQKIIINDLARLAAIVDSAVPVVANSSKVEDETNRFLTGRPLHPVGNLGKSPDV
jgi:CRP/FNR family transcriptional regulator, cyclic AMP receptor protein